MRPSDEDWILKLEYATSWIEYSVLTVEEPMYVEEYVRLSNELCMNTRDPSMLLEEQLMISVESSMTNRDLVMASMVRPGHVVVKMNVEFLIVIVESCMENGTRGKLNDEFSMCR